MSVDDGPSVEMEFFATFEQPLSAADAERLLSGHGAGPDAPEEQQALAMMLGHAAGPASTQELAGEVSAVAVFSLLQEQKTRRARARRRPVLAACASAAIAMALSGTAAADALPAPMQRVAHDTFGAPAPRHAAPSVNPSPVVRHVNQLPANATSGKPASAKISHGEGKGQGKGNGQGEGKALGKVKAVGKVKSAKAQAKPKPVPVPVAHGVAKGHSAGHGHE